MLRKIIKINQEKCNGCGLCAAACHEGAIELINGKAVLARESYCDGLGDCLPSCPAGAISFEEREAPAYDEAAVLAAKRQKSAVPCACPGSRARVLPSASADAEASPVQSCLAQWPVQIKLAPINAPYFGGAELLIAADCTAYAYGDFHNSFMKGRITLIGCPKLDAVNYAEKLTAILAGNDIRTVTVVRMEVPCCGGIENAVKTALQCCGKSIAHRVVTVSTDGRISD